MTQLLNTEHRACNSFTKELYDNINKLLMMAAVVTNTCSFFTFEKQLRDYYTLETNISCSNQKKITWISRKPERIQMCLENFKAKIGKKHTFKNCMDKIKLSVDHTMKRSYKKKPGGKSRH